MAKDDDFENAVEQFNAAFNAGKGWFDFFSDDCVVFPAGAVEPIRGRKEYEANFGESLGSGSRTAKVIDQSLERLENLGIATQVLQQEQENITLTVRESSLWSIQSGRWQIHHLHVSTVGPASSTVPTTTPSEVKVLSEKIGTVSSAVGVAQ